MRCSLMLLLAAACAPADRDASPDELDASELMSITPATCPSGIDAPAVALCQATGAAGLVAGVDFATLDDAVAAAPVGGEVVVCPGTYSGPLVLSAPITVRAADPTPNATVLTGNGVTRALEALETVHLSGLTLFRGYHRTFGGGAYIQGPQSELDCMTVAYNHVDRQGAGGGGVGVVGDEVIVRNSTFVENHAFYEGGALDILGDGVSSVIDSAFYRNTSRDEGGAVKAAVDLRLVGGTFIENHAGYNGGALAWGERDNPLQLHIEGSTFLRNSSGYEAGAVDAGSWFGSNEVWISGSTFEANTARWQGGALDFGLWGSVDAHLADCVFSENRAPAAGAISMEVQQGGALDIARTDFVRNRSAWGGAALSTAAASGGVVVSLTDVRVGDNVGGRGVLAMGVSDSLQCTRCTFGVGARANAPADVAAGGRAVVHAPANFAY